MKTIFSSHTIRNSLIATAFVTALTLPLFATASILNASAADARSAQNNTDLSTYEGRERLYQKLKSKSRETCGPTNIRVTGSIERSVKNEQCFEATLAVAVERVDNEAITALHQQ